jgi:hypothetical protein
LAGPTRLRLRGTRPPLPAESARPDPAPRAKPAPRRGFGRGVCYCGPPRGSRLAHRRGNIRAARVSGEGNATPALTRSESYLSLAVSALSLGLGEHRPRSGAIGRLPLELPQRDRVRDPRAELPDAAQHVLFHGKAHQPTPLQRAPALVPEPPPTSNRRRRARLRGAREQRFIENAIGAQIRVANKLLGKCV